MIPMGWNFGIVWRKKTTKPRKKNSHEFSPRWTRTCDGDPWENRETVGVLFLGSIRCVTQCASSRRSKQEECEQNSCLPKISGNYEAASFGGGAISLVLSRRWKSFPGSQQEFRSRWDCFWWKCVKTSKYGSFGGLMAFIIELRLG